MMQSRVGIAGCRRRESRAILEGRLRSALIRVLRYKDLREEFPLAYKSALDELVNVRLTLKDLEEIAEPRRAA
ncbi:MAG: hypothetical protein E3J72_20420 [Planctomycetota bacterium]|nr:MAG: hypothetical protein E3J72_20420 [Planctomycetota bacterium]